MSKYEPTRFEYVFRDTRYGTYYFRGTVQRQFVERSLQTDKISEAKVRADKIRAAPEDHVTLARFTFQAVFDLVLKMQSAKSKKTNDEARNYIDNHLRPWFSRQCPLLATFERNFESIWTDYIIAQKEIDPERSLKHDRKALIFVLLRAHNRKWVKRQFGAKDLPLNEASEPIGKYIEKEDVQRILTYLKPHSKIYLQVLIAVTMGMRLREILHLSKEEIDLKNREINLDPHRLKIRQPRKVPIPISDLVYPLLEKAYCNAEGSYIFPAMMGNLSSGYEMPDKAQDNHKYWWIKMREELKLEIRFHDLRHTAITNALAKGLPSITASKIFGASQKTIARVYDHLKQDVKDFFRRMHNDDKWN